MLITIALAIWLAYLTYRSITMAVDVTTLANDLAQVKTDFGSYVTQQDAKDAASAVAIADLQAQVAAGTPDLSSLAAGLASLDADIKAKITVPPVA